MDWDTLNTQISLVLTTLFCPRLISVPKFIQGYNGKPALVTKSGGFQRYSNYIEFTINVGMWV